MTPEPAASPASTSPPRVLGLRAATGLGIASMLGAGVFYVWSPAASAAGSLLPVALVIAAVVAALNALSTMRLAVAHPVAGGAYAYGRAELGPRAGFAAGMLFLLGKTASSAAIALVAATYLWPEAGRPLALGCLAVVAAVNILGVRRSARVAGVVAAIVILTVATVIAVGLLRDGGDAPLLGVPYAGPSAGSATEVLVVVDPSAGGVLAAASLIFFAFAGYARIATLAEEVRAPERTLPRAALVSLGLVLVVYAALATALLIVLGPERIAASATPLADLAGEGWQVPVRIVAGVAALGSLLAVLAGLGRTAFAMAREGDLPRPFARLSGRGSAPQRADAAVAILGLAAVALLPTETLVALSSASVLGYYAVAHAASLRRPGSPVWRVVAVAGALGCTVLVLSTPPAGVLALAVLVLLALVIRELPARTGRAHDAPPT